MNLKSIRIEHDSHADFEQLASRSVSIIAAIRTQLSALLFRSELQKARAGYRLKQQRRQRNQAATDALTGFSIDEKLRHGLYRFMD